MDRVVGFSPDAESSEAVDGVSASLLSVSGDSGDSPEGARGADALRVGGCALTGILTSVRYSLLADTAVKSVASTEGSRLLLKALSPETNIEAGS